MRRACSSADACCACLEAAAGTSDPDLALAGGTRVQTHAQRWDQPALHSVGLTEAPLRKKTNLMDQQAAAAVSPAADAAAAVSPAAAAAVSYAAAAVLYAAAAAAVSCAAAADVAGQVAAFEMVGCPGGGGGRGGFHVGGSRRPGGCHSSTGPSPTACSPTHTYTDQMLNQTHTIDQMLTYAHTTDQVLTYTHTHTTDEMLT